MVYEGVWATRGMGSTVLLNRVPFNLASRSAVSSNRRFIFYTAFHQHTLTHIGYLFYHRKDLEWRLHHSQSRTEVQANNSESVLSSGFSMIGRFAKYTLHNLVLEHA